MTKSIFKLSRRHFIRNMALVIGSVSIWPLVSRAAKSTMVRPAKNPISGDFYPFYSQDPTNPGPMVLMNTGTLGPALKKVIQKNQTISIAMAQDPKYPGPYRVNNLNREREEIAKFINADVSGLFYTRSTTEGMSVFAQGLDWRANDVVITTTHEHPGGLQPYELLQKRYGIKIIKVDVPKLPINTDQIIDYFTKAIREVTRNPRYRLRVLMVSHVTWFTGLLMPIKELAALAHRYNMLISVDGAHALGMLDINLKEVKVDHYAASGQKWLFCGTGTGIAYIDKTIHEQVWPLMQGNVEQRGDNERRYPGAARYERNGQKDVSRALGMIDAIEYQNNIGRTIIENRIRELATYLRNKLVNIPRIELLSSPKSEFNSGLTSFQVEGLEGHQVANEIWQKERIHVLGLPNVVIPKGLVRVSTNIFNTHQEIDVLINRLTIMLS